MFAAVLGFLLKLAGSSAVDKVLGHLQAKANSETERLRIETLRQTTMAGYSRDVVVAGMNFEASLGQSERDRTTAAEWLPDL